MTTSAPADASAASSSLLLFVPAQNPLPVRYPHPHKPRLHLPSLVHRALHTALDAETPSFTLASAPTSGSSSSASSSASTSQLIIPHPDVIVKQDEPLREDKVPPANGAGAGVNGSEGPSKTLAEEQGIRTGPEGLVGAQVESEITFKLHLVGSPSSTSQRVEWVREALAIAAQYKGLSRVDTLLIGFKGVDYKGKKTAVSEFFGCGAEGMESGSGVENVGQEVENEVYETWAQVKQALGGQVGTLGTLYLPLGVLRRLTEDKGEGGEKGEGRNGPTINMLDTPDCHSLPKEYTAYAKDNDIALWAGGGGEGADADLHNVLNEFYPTIAAADAPVPRGLNTLIPLRDDELKYEASPAPAVTVRWALGYTIISKSRNVVKDKGYIISAALAQ